MVKVRMNTADVVAEVACLRRLIGMRCVNVYDISPKAYLFKLVNSSGVTESGESEKVLLLMESGVRLHTTEYIRDKSTTPSGFTLKLRKHIRSKRLEDIRQLGYDRIILFQFGQGPQAHYIILELYAQGNILLADSSFTVMTLLRSHRDDDKGLAIMSRHRYPVEQSRVFQKTTLTKLQEALSSLREPSNMDANESIENNSIKPQEKHPEKAKKSAKSNDKVNDGGKSTKLTLKNVLGTILGYGPALSEHMILDAGLSPNLKIDQALTSLEDESVLALSLAVARFEDWVSIVMSGQKIPEGYILMQNKISGKKESVLPQDPISGKMYDEFCPILLHQFQMRELVKFETFDAAMDEFYSKIESQRSDQQKKAKEEAALQKLNKIRADQENRVEALKKEVDHSIKMGELIEYNLEDVEAAIMAVRVALAKGMDWQDLARMVKEEKKMGNPVAGLIDKLHLERNSITLLLSKNLDDMDDEEITQPVDKVDVDLALSAHANARRWYELKKKQEVKQEKTVSAHEKAFKAAERKTKLQLAQEKTVAAISHVRRVHWFEKFNWFISSENYLVISGRDAQQNEMIVKRYMSKGDLYVHADLHGASSTVIKNHNPEHPIPPLTLNQAGCYTVCQSKAWDSKIVTSAWWVYTHQVSKTAPTGEYLTVGSFMIRGKKNFLPPHPLVMGFGILFRLDESSLGPHVNERRVRGEEDEAHQPPRADSEDAEESQEHAFRSTDKVLDERNQAEEAPLSSKLEEILDSALSLGPLKRVEVKGEGKLPDPEDSKVTTRGNPYISKAERRKVKKDETGKSSMENSHWVSQNTENGGNLKAVGPKITRGQKGKLKKMKEKYADQDDEERRIRMALLAISRLVRATQKLMNQTKKRSLLRKTKQQNPGRLNHPNYAINVRNLGICPGIAKNTQRKPPNWAIHWLPRQSMFLIEF
ncbi:zinc knuckle (CCHC-type) family protein isoform X3 [Wolffia australiana]